MNWLLLATLLAVSIWLTATGFSRPGKIYEYPFLAGTTFLGFVLPQLPAFAGDPFLPEGAFAKTVLFTTLCAAACGAGWAVGNQPMRILAWRLHERRLLWVAALLSVAGAFFYFKLSRLPKEVLSGSMYTGLPVMYLFFGKLVGYAFVTAVLCFMHRPRALALAIALFDAVLMLDRIVVGGRKSEFTEVLLAILIAAWFRRGIAVPGAIGLAGVLAAGLALNSTGDYRSITQGEDPKFSELSRIDVFANFISLLHNGGPEMRNAILRINATDRSLIFDFGTFHWNVLVFNFVPAQLVGTELKESLVLSIPGSYDRDYAPPTGSTETGMADAFASFWYFGAVKFFLIAYFLGRIYRAGMAGSAAAQLLYILSVVPAMLAITHHTQWILSAWVQMGMFLLPGLALARARGSAIRPQTLGALRHEPRSAAGARRQFIILPALFVALLTPIPAWTASTTANLDIVVPPGQTIAAVNLSNSSFSGGAPSGTTVGSISVTMSPASPPFSGTLSLTGTNAGNFQIVGSSLVTNGIDPAGNYGINIVATEPGAVGSPSTQTETIVGTSAGSPLAICPGTTYTYNLVTNFGAVSNNVAATDAALRAFNIEAQKRTRPPEGSYPGYYSGAGKDNCIILNIPAGAFQYTFNSFGRQIRHLKIVGAGSGLRGGAATTMQNVLSGGNFFTSIPFTGNWDYFGDGFYQTPPYDHYGYLIKTTNVGDTQVTLSNHANASLFLVGRWVLVMSYNQQWYGYPPNMRYYDYAKVTSANPTTGVIGLDTQLRYAHRSDRPYNGTLTDGPAGTWGPASIVPIDTPDKTIGEYHEYDGLNVLGNPHWNASTIGCPQANCDLWQVSGLIDGAMNDVKLQYALGTVQLRNFTITNSQWSYDEADKIISQLIYQNCTIADTAVHAGELLWHVSGGHIGTASVSAMHAIFDGGALIDGMLSSTDWTAGIQLDRPNQTLDLTVDGVTFKGNGNTTNFPVAGPQQSPGPWTIDGSIITLAAGPNGANTRLKVTKDLGTYGSASENIVDNWGEGDPIMKNGSFVAGAIVTLITGDANYIYVDVIGTTFVYGDTVWAARVPTVSVKNSVGQNTGFTWGSPNISHGDNIPTILWSNNSGN
jgi:hypothetical protein